MYENETREVLERRMMDRLDPKFDPRIGSVLQTNHASLAIELAKLYELLDYSNRQINPDTADREHLEEWAGTFSITPLPATYAILKAEIKMKNNKTCPIGSRFNQGSLSFSVITYNGGVEYSIQCEQAGEEGNAAYGRIIPIVYIPDLLSARILSVEIPGTDVEDDDSLRERLRNNFREKSYGWNMATYRQEIAKIQGVGGFKVIRYFQEKDWYVGIYLTDSDYNAASKELVDLVQETLLPILPDYSEPNIKNSGDGLVAIGHVPIVKSVEERVINIKVDLVYGAGLNFESCKEEIEKVLKDYLYDLNKGWEDQDHITIMQNIIWAKIYEANVGATDLIGITVNGESENYALNEFEITKLGTVTGA